MKIGGLTWWRNNYGSILQAYALQQELNEYENIEYEIICQYGKKIASVDNLIDKIKSIGLRKTIYKFFWKFCIPGINQRNQKIQLFVDQFLTVSKKQYTYETINDANNIYDGFICGSDQVWNLTLVNTKDIYWLGSNEISEQQKVDIRDNLMSFEAVSCREEIGTEALNKILGKDICKTVLDPTMLVQRKLWDDLCQSISREYFPKPYIFVYMLRGTRQQRKTIELYARAHKMKIVTIPFLETEKIELYDFKFGDIKIWDADPIDFINLVRNAECVFTDSFHSTVFSCLYHVPFFIFPKIGATQMNRLEALQTLLGIESRVVHNIHEINLVELKKIDWIKVEEKLQKYRSKSKKFLSEAIDQGKEKHGSICL